ncbi:ATP-dependent DNA helicase RecG [Patescibacteria group bacterium]|nr:ATP-dependent DNA helicase RecG [Patescibacteria group bacterium]
MDLQTKAADLFMVGPTYAKRLEKLNIETVEDLLYHFPFRYEDYSLISPINKVQPEETVTIKGTIIEIKNQYTRHGRKIQKAQVSDNSGQIEIIWFNQPFLIKILKIGEDYRFSGKIDWFGRQKVMLSPDYESTDSKIHTGRLVPVYHETYGITSKWLRSRISWLIKQMKSPVADFLPETIRKKHRLEKFNQALKSIHFPKDMPVAEKAKARFAFEELFLLQLEVCQRKQAWQKEKLAFQFFVDQEKVLEFMRNLPFELTRAQKRASREILSDLGQNNPMNRLLQGDVGSGKTVIAALAIYLAWLNNTQSALMAPTEILAYQHYQTLKQLLASLGLKVFLLTGSLGIKTENFDVLIGTHALIHKRAQFKKLGLVIIDEQQRFGVEQRAKLIQKANLPQKRMSPHILTMTATPIPRTIALTLYGDLSLSVLDEMPPGRQKIKTWVVSPQKRNSTYKWIRERIKDSDEQAFIICPLIEESETLQSVKAAKVEFENLSKKVFTDLKLGLLHGRMKSQEKNEAMKQFKEGHLDILVATPVVEVGIDIPQATIMLIEGAERFGLSQLHQLRGRVGRGSKESFCLLFTPSISGKSFERIKALEKINIGSQLAELDLKLRGPGEIYGTAQHGFPDLKIASFTDLNLIEKTKQAAGEILPKVVQYPLLQAKLKKDKIKNIEPN